ncbi:hypothetical protein DVB69_06120 [Sporosarcina sp. BI001-red]|uniref:hypothetical protein n=1 Tax=Sporosarcina sp. BI001-red TaxID=2282866 RepID=UPI000E24901D|nr:hypothetical protein [Sporosarcina sp. BI001-red]REB08702.1 hypothetical protein DVB69_06120 [Sporosarcina sp. BI001-red]
MRNFIVVFCTSILLFLLPAVVLANENQKDQKEEKRGLVGGLLHQAKDTVDKTVKSTGDLANETVKFTGDTVERTVDFTSGTVNTLADPNQKRPVKSVVENTTNFVGETMESTVPVVGQTTKTVQTVTNETVKVTKTLPKVPVVTQVVDKTTETVNKTTEQVKETVDKTVGAVTETVSKPLKKQPVNETPSVVEVKPTEQPSQKPSVEQPKRPAVIEKPREEQDPVADGNPSEIPSSGKRLEAKPENDNIKRSPVKENIEEDLIVSIEQVVSKETEQSSTYSVQGVKRIEEQFTMERKDKQTETSSTNSKAMNNNSNQAFPLKPSNRSSWMSDVQLITGSSSIRVSASSVSSGISGIGAVLADDWLMKTEIIRQKWYSEDILGTLQWSHAPPGQPPQSTPFLYVI